jgi:hypothetical protein
VQIFQNQEQLGSTQNFNKAMRLCKGEYIALSDQDDRWRADKLHRLCEILDSNGGVGVVFSDAALIDADSQQTGLLLWNSFHFGTKTQSTFTADPGRVLMEGPVVTGATMVFRRSLLGFFTVIPDGWVHDAWITWMGVFWSRVTLTPETLTEYRIHSSQQLGVGKASLSARIKAIQSKQRDRYSVSASQLLDLLKYLGSASPELHKRWEMPFTRFIKFFKARASAPENFSGRMLFVIRHLPSYRSLARSTWRSLLRDLVLSNKENS